VFSGWLTDAPRCAITTACRVVRRGAADVITGSAGSDMLGDGSGERLIDRADRAGTEQVINSQDQTPM
jgi:hypothetical protein